MPENALGCFSMTTKPNRMKLSGIHRSHGEQVYTKFGAVPLDVRLDVLWFKREMCNCVMKMHCLAKFASLLVNATEKCDRFAKRLWIKNMIDFTAATSRINIRRRIEKYISPTELQ